MAQEAKEAVAHSAVVGMRAAVMAVAAKMAVVAAEAAVVTVGGRRCSAHSVAIRI